MSDAMESTTPNPKSNPTSNPTSNPKSNPNINPNRDCMKLMNFVMGCVTS